MIRATAIIVCTVMVVEFFVDWIRSLMDESNAEDVLYCYNCPHGWCMEVPGSKGCKKVRGEN